MLLMWLMCQMLLVFENRSTFGGQMMLSDEEIIVEGEMVLCLFPAYPAW